MERYTISLGAQIQQLILLGIREKLWYLNWSWQVKGTLSSYKRGAGIQAESNSWATALASVCSGNNWCQVAGAQVHGCDCLTLKLGRWGECRLPQSWEPRWSSGTVFCKERCRHRFRNGGGWGEGIIHASWSYCVRTILVFCEQKELSSYLHLVCILVWERKILKTHIYNVRYC